jgi:glycosyltransferase involved in cell wall biosynthesis
MEFKRLLYMSELPPSTAGGQPLIVTKLLRDYDMDRLDILCDARQHRVEPLVSDTFLPCRHTTIRNAERHTALRPRRAFGLLGDNLNLLRIGTIVRAAKRIIAARKVEAMFTVPWRCDFALAAYRTSLDTGLPLYVFETDDWYAMNRRPFTGQVVKRYQGPLLRRATKLWVTSPSMADRYREQFGVDGEFLFHYVDVMPYVTASAERERLSDPGVLRLAYTGAINTMFWDTMLLICRQINDGLEVEGRRVELDVYGGGLPEVFRGPQVHYRGLVASDDIPAVLAAADVVLIAVTFDRDPDLVALVGTSLYTKTVDYLASGRPVLIVSPPYAAEVSYFGEVATVVDTPDTEQIADALGLLACDAGAVRAQCERGLDFVRANHSLERRERVFLRHFITDRGHV